MKAAMTNVNNEKLKEKILSLRADLEVLETLTTEIATARKEYVSGALKLPTATMTQRLVLLDAKLVHI